MFGPEEKGQVKGGPRVSPPPPRLSPPENRRGAGMMRTTIFRLSPVLLLAAALIAVAVISLQPSPTQAQTARETLWFSTIVPLKMVYPDGTVYGCNDSADASVSRGLGTASPRCDTPWMKKRFTLQGNTFEILQIAKDNSTTGLNFSLLSPTGLTPQALIDTGRLEILPYVAPEDVAVTKYGRFTPDNAANVVSLDLADGHSGAAIFSWASTSVGDWDQRTCRARCIKDPDNPGQLLPGQNGTSWGQVTMRLTWVPPAPANPPTAVSVTADRPFREGGGPVTVTFTLDHPAHRDDLRRSSWINFAGGEYFVTADRRLPRLHFPYGSRTATMTITPKDDSLDNNCRRVVQEYVFRGGLRANLNFTIIDDDGAPDTGCTGLIGSAVPTGLTLEVADVAGDADFLLVSVLARLDKPPMPFSTGVTITTGGTATRTHSFDGSTGDYYAANTHLTIYNPNRNARFTGSRGSYDGHTHLNIFAGADDSETIVLTATSAATSYRPQLTSAPLTLTIGQLRQRVSTQEAPGYARLPTAATLTLDAATVSESVGTVTITATLDAPAPPEGASFRLVASPDDTATRDVDYTMPASIDIPAGALSTSVWMTITDDSVVELDETVSITAFASLYHADLTGRATLTITDNDTAGVIITAASPMAVDEGGTATYTVVLESRPTEDVTVTATSDDDGAATVSPASHTFTPTNWDTPVTFTVSGVADTDTNDETVGISHSVTSDDGKYAAVLLSMVRVSVSDTTASGLQGQNPPPNRAPTVASTIGDATIVSESGTKQVSLPGVFSDDDRDSLAVTATSSNQAVATVSVSADYSSLTVTGKSRGTTTITVTAADGNGGTVSDSFTVKVKAAPVVASALDNINMTEGDAQDVSLSGVFSDADGDALTITTDSSDFAVANAFAFQDTLSIVGVSAGSATITVTAQDADGNTVSDEFSVTITAPEPEPANQPPTVSSALSDATIVNESGTKQVSLSGVFSDADGDPLTITAGSSNDAVVTVSASADYASLTVSAQSSGTATITVTADDGNGGTVDDTFTVTVKAAPVVAQPLADVSGLEAGSSRDVSLAGVFSDADGDSLTVAAGSSNNAIATVTVAGGGYTLTLGGVAEGAATITVTAQDSDGNRASDDFTVSVEPKPEEEEPERETSDGSPTVVSPLPDISLEGLQWRQYSLPDVFQDPDGDELTFTSVSSNYDVASTWVSGSTLTVLATGTGTATITVTAEDPDGNRVSDELEVTVTPAS